MKGCRLLSPACIRDEVLDKVDDHFASSEMGFQDSLEVPQLPQTCICKCI